METTKDITIIIKYLGGTKQEFTMAPENFTVKQLRNMILIERYYDPAKEDYGDNFPKMIFKGKQLRNDEPFSYYNIGHGDMINVVFKRDCEHFFPEKWPAPVDD